MCLSVSNSVTVFERQKLCSLVGGILCVCVAVLYASAQVFYVCVCVKVFECMSL